MPRRRATGWQGYGLPSAATTPKPFAVASRKILVEMRLDAALAQYLHTVKYPLIFNGNILKIGQVRIDGWTTEDTRRCGVWGIPGMVCG